MQRCIKSIKQLAFSITIPDYEKSNSVSRNVQALALWTFRRVVIDIKGVFISIGPICSISHEYDML